MSDHIESTSDQRIINNVMRHEYRVLHDMEKDQMSQLKDMGLAMWNLIDGIGNDVPRAEGTPGGSRELSLAKTKVEEAVMWAVKHITR